MSDRLWKNTIFLGLEYYSLLQGLQHVMKLKNLERTTKDSGEKLKENALLD